MVVPCTGRCWAESRRYLPQLTGLEIGVFVTGAVINLLPSGESRQVSTLGAATARQLVEHLAHWPEAVLVFCDRTRAGVDYLVCGSGDLTGNTQFWFDMNGLETRTVREPTEADLEHALRVGMVAPHSRMEEAVSGIRPELAEGLLIHHFDAVQMPDAEPMSVLEVFDRGVDKWQGLLKVAVEHDIEPEAIAVIGDQINDLAMLRQAGCGIAMANAPDSVKQVARHVTRGNHEQGVAHAIERLMGGEW